MVKLIINGTPVEVPEGITLVNAARLAGFTIPTLCDLPGLDPYGGCRLCMVEGQGWEAPRAACTQLVSEGMVIETETPILIRARKAILELLLSDYYDGKLAQAGNEDNALPFSEEDIGADRLAYWALFYGIDAPRAMSTRRRYPVDNDPHPYIRVDLNKCIVCTLCIRACAEIQGRFIWALAERSRDTRIVAGANTDLLTAGCESCGACVDCCPTGALADRLSFELGPADSLTTTTCPQCSLGCQISLNVKDGKIIRVTPVADVPIDKGHLCAKGRYGYEFIHKPERLTQPRMRRYLLEGQPKTENGRLSVPGSYDWVEVDWETALSLTAKKLQESRDAHGLASVGFLAAPTYLNEEHYLFNKLARQAIGSNHIDLGRGNSCGTIHGLLAAFGAGVTSNSLKDAAARARAYFIIGADLMEEYPVFGARLRQAALRRNAQIISANPRGSRLDDFAALRLHQKPGSNLALLNGLMYILFEKGQEDWAFLAERGEGLARFKASVMRYPPKKAAEITGLPVETLHRAAEMLAAHRPAAVIWAADSMGKNEAAALANLQMLLGNLGQPGGGVFPLGRGGNAQGASDMGNLPGYYPGYQPVESDAVRQKFLAAWGAAAPLEAGMNAAEIFSALSEGGLTALYLLGDALPLADAGEHALARRGLETAGFVVFQGYTAGESADYADVLLPGVSFAEKNGTFTSAERRVQRVRQAIAPLEDARPDWQIIAEIGRRIVALGGTRQIAAGPLRGWEYADAAEILTEIGALAPDYGGITYERLDSGDGLQWPCPDRDHPGTPILPISQFASGKGRLIPSDPPAPTPPTKP